MSPVGGAMSPDGTPRSAVTMALNVAVGGKADDRRLGVKPKVALPIGARGQLRFIHRLSTDHTSRTLYKFLRSAARVGSGKTTALIRH